MPERSASALEDTVAKGLRGGRNVAWVRNVPLAQLTTWNIGGEARYLVEPDTPFELGAAVAQARAAGEPTFVLGRGSNVLVDDTGIPGLVVCLRRALRAIEPMPDAPGTYRVQAGCPLPSVATTAARDGVTGLEFLIGIPGTMGAGVAINAGLGGEAGTALDSVLIEALLLNPATGTLERVPASELALGYRTSNVPQRGAWVLEATVRGQGAPLHDVRVRQKEIQRARAAKQPLQRKTSGSVFKQPPGGNPAGWYIDRAGLKGHCVGSAVVSDRHANWIENRGGASSEDVRALISHVREAVHASFGIRLEREVRFLPQDATDG